MVRILHAADLHLDSRFEALGAQKAALRRAEQRDMLRRIIELAEREKAQIVLLSGDLFDSDRAYYETASTLSAAFAATSARIFISPGNHDFYSANSPYNVVRLPENVYVFKSPEIEAVELPELECTVYGSAFVSAYSESMLKGFTAAGMGTRIIIMHGDLEAPDSRYNPVTEQDAADSGADYIALGHNHTFSGVRKAGNTYYACPGCPEGRGFDEPGEKGVLVGEVGRGTAELEFVPLGGRKYSTLTVDVTGKDVEAAFIAALPDDAQRDIFRVILTGECSGAPNTAALEAAGEEKFFSLSVRDATRPERDIWEQTGEKTLRGIFLSRMREKYDAADETERGRIIMAVRFALAAMDNSEGWR
ncbi:MAG: DNA repair exonuclease [Oscillospiraceae bacterium]|nr:DNA repair exonuclease [Oscillospiraceae bacterium]